MFLDQAIQNEQLAEMGSSYESVDALGAVRSPGFQPNLRRVFTDPAIDQGRMKLVTINTGEVKWDDERSRYIPVYETVPVKELTGTIYEQPVWNVGSTLRKDQWAFLDRIMVSAARRRLRAWNGLLSAGSLGGFDGYSKTILEHETQNDPGFANVDMDGLTEGPNDIPKVQLEALPLPITHSDFHVGDRKLAISRNNGGPGIDSTMAEACGRRVAEAVEQTVIGVQAGLAYGTDVRYGRASQVYGFLNFPDRITVAGLTAPTNANGVNIVNDVLSLREAAYQANFFGPYTLYVSNVYDQFLDNDFKANSDMTVRDRILRVDGIRNVVRLDYLTGTRMILVQQTPDVARAINGMDITTMQWETKGGLQHNFKVMAIWVPQLRADFNGNCGIVEGTL